MWKLLSFFSLFLFTACGSNDSEFKWDQSTDSYLYEGSMGIVSVSLGKEDSSNHFRLVTDPKKNRDGIDMIQVVVSSSLSKNPPTATYEGPACCFKKGAQRIELKKVSSTQKEITYRGELVIPLDKSKPPYTFLFKFGMLNLRLEL